MSAREHATFVDAMSSEIIQRVSLVMPLADKLLEQGMLHPEAYSQILVAKTSQTQMRLLYQSLHTDEVKSAFYIELKKCDSSLVKDLEKTFRNKDKQPWDSQRALLDVGEREANVLQEKPQKLEARWQKNSLKWEEKLRQLLKDPDGVWMGKLFVCTENQEYEIGKGCYGTRVYIGMKDDGTEVAVKEIDKDKDKELENEKSILRSLESKHVVKYIDFVQGKKFDYLALQLCECTLDEFVKELHVKELSREERAKHDGLKKLAYDLLVGLRDLHSANVIHRDIKPSNVLIDVKGNARLADFGISRKLADGMSTLNTTRAGTLGWMAAEILGRGNSNEKCKYNKSSDIQVAGMLVYYILSGGSHPFGDDLLNIRTGDYSLKEVQDVEAKDLIEDMIANDPKNRPSAVEALQHPYFWDEHGRDGFLRKIGDEHYIQKFKEENSELDHAVHKFTQGRTFSGWKSKIDALQDKISYDSKVQDDLRGLLRFVRNCLVHKKDVFDKHNMFKDFFPDYFLCAYKLAKEMGWKVLPYPEGTIPPRP